MEAVIPLTKDIYWLGVNDYETCLFEAIWPLPHGVSYNSYIIKDTKVALLDTVKKSFFDTYLAKIKKTLAEGQTVDYLIVNHMEPDHSGSIQVLCELFPKMQIIGNEKTANFLKLFYGVDSNVRIVKDGDTLDLGTHRLKFFLTPMVHWPETMVTYEEKNKILFSADAFGGFGALNGGIFDDEVDLSFYVEETRRYFSNIVGKYCVTTQKAIQKLKGLDVKIIASTHGPIFRKNPAYIINLYDQWSRHQTEPGVVIVYASMYGNTQKMAEAVARGITEAGQINTRVHNISYIHISFIINDIWRFKGLALGSCTYNTKLFPLMENLLCILENDAIKNHVLGIFGSYSWSGGSLQALDTFAKKSNWQFIEPVVEVQCSPTEENLAACRTLGKNLAQAAK